MVEVGPLVRLAHASVVVLVVRECSGIIVVRRRVGVKRILGWRGLC